MRPTRDKPTDVVLLVTVPLDKPGFLAGLANSDFRGKYAADPEGFWSTDYVPEIAAPLAATLQDAIKLGAEVRLNATLDDLAEATTQRSVVIVFAHWKDSQVAVSDIIPSADTRRRQFIEAARQSKKQAAQWFLAEMEGRHGRLFMSRPSYAIDDVLNRFREEVLPSDIPEGVTEMWEDKETRAARRRDDLDSVFVGLLRAGNRLEMASGLHSRQEIADAISPDFRGVLDLTNCNSTILATALNGRSGYRYRILQYPRPVDLSWAAMTVKGTLAQLATGLFEYAEARLAITAILDREFQRTK